MVLEKKRNRDEGKREQQARDCAFAAPHRDKHSENQNEDERVHLRSVAQRNAWCIRTVTRGRYARLSRKAIMLRHHRQHVDATRCIAVLVVIPTNQLEEAI